MCHGARTGATCGAGTVQPGWTTHLQCIRPWARNLSPGVVRCIRRILWFLSSSWARKVGALLHQRRWWRSGPHVVAWRGSGLCCWRFWRKVDAADFQDASSWDSLTERFAETLFSSLPSASRVCLWQSLSQTWHWLAGSSGKSGGFPAEFWAISAISAIPSAENAAQALGSWVCGAGKMEPLSHCRCEVEDSWKIGCIAPQAPPSVSKHVLMLILFSDPEAGIPKDCKAPQPHLCVYIHIYIYTHYTHYTYIYLAPIIQLDGKLKSFQKLNLAFWFKLSATSPAL